MFLTDADAWRLYCAARLAELDPALTSHGVDAIACQLIELGVSANVSPIEAAESFIASRDQRAAA